MSKLYEHYKMCKEKEKEKLVLIKSGTFYIILDEDAKMVSEKLGLKLTMLNENIVKCGFPINSLEKYEKMLNANGIEFILTNLNLFDTNTQNNIEKSIIKNIKNLNINEISPICALNLLVKYNEKLNNK